MVIESARSGVYQPVVCTTSGWESAGGEELGGPPPSAALAVGGTATNSPTTPAIPAQTALARSESDMGYMYAVIAVLSFSSTATI
jgi:hypothetical protein